MAVEGRHDWKAAADYCEVDFDYPEWGVIALILQEEAVLGKAHIHMILVTICQLGSVDCDVAYKTYCRTIAIAQILLILSQMPQNARGMSDHLHDTGCKDKSNSNFARFI